MKFCMNCGSKLEEGAKFCSECGEAVKIEQEEKEEVELEETTIDDIVDEPLYAEIEDDLAKTQIMRPIEEEEDGEDDFYEEEPMERGIKDFKIPLIIVAVLVVGLIAFFLFKGTSKKGNKDELIEEFIDGVASRDVNKVVKILEARDSDLKIDSFGVEAFFAYIDENPAYLEEMESSLERQSLKYDNSEVVDGRGDNIVLDTKNDKDYSLIIKPYYMELKLDFKDSTIYMNDKKIGETSTDGELKKYGPYMPGIYDLKVEYGNNMEAQHERIELFDENPLDDRVEMSFHIDSGVKEVRITSEDKDAEIYVDGQKIGKKIGDLENSSLSYLTDDSRIQIAVDTPWGEFKSKEVRVGDSSGTIDFKLNLAESKAGESLKATVEKFLREDVQAKKNLDASSYTSLEDPELMIRKARIDQIKAGGYYVESELTNILYNLDSIGVAKYEEGYHGEISISFNLKEIYFWTYAREEQEGKVEMDISLNYHEGKNEWKIYNINENSSLKDIQEAPVEE